MNNNNQRMPGKRKIFFNSVEQNTEMSEAFRTIRTNLSFLNEKEMGRKLVFTSSIPGEGKTSVASNYAASLAIAGRKTLLIDCDIRRPRAIASFGLEVHKGLESILKKEAEIEEVIVEDVIDNLDILPAKYLNENVTELFLGDGLTELLHKVENKYNTIILDTAPLTVASDAAILSKYVDGVVVIVAYDLVAEKELKFTKEMLTNAGANVYGFIVNRVDSTGLSYGNYGYYNNNYSYYKEYYKEDGVKKVHKVHKGKFGKILSRFKDEYKQQFTGDLKERRKK